MKENQPKLVCPLCGGPLFVNQKLVKCKNDDCGWGLWRTIAGKYLSDDVIQELLTTGRTDVLEGFVGKSGKPFRTALKMNPEGRLDFIFPNRKPGGSRGLRLVKKL